MWCSFTCTCDYGSARSYILPRSQVTVHLFNSTLDKIIVIFKFVAIIEAFRNIFLVQLTTSVRLNPTITLQIIDTPTRVRIRHPSLNASAVGENGIVQCA